MSTTTIVSVDISTDIPPIFDGRHWSAEYRSTYRPTNRARLGRFRLSLLVQRSIDAQSTLNRVTSDVLRNI